MYVIQLCSLILKILVFKEKYILWHVFLKSMSSLHIPQSLQGKVVNVAAGLRHALAVTGELHFRCREKLGY